MKKERIKWTFTGEKYEISEKIETEQMSYRKKDERRRTDEDTKYKKWTEVI